MIAAGVVLACVLIRSRKSNPDVIKPGDKGTDVYGLQSALASMTGLKFPNMGAYDSGTLTAVQYYMQGTDALVNHEKGYVDKSFAMDLQRIQEKIK